jgi:cardiolipin synthase
MNTHHKTKAWGIIIALALICSFSNAQNNQTIKSDSLIKSQLEDYGIRFTNNNSVTLLMSGQEKFDDMFEAIRQAKHSVHLEYFNFRNDSIAMLLFEILREKRKEGVEIRAMFDGFGNDSNNQPLKKHHLENQYCRLTGQMSDYYLPVQKKKLIQIHIACTKIL